MPEYMTSFPMTSLTLDAIACKEEDAVVVEYILKGKFRLSLKISHIVLEDKSDCPWRLVRLTSYICQISSYFSQIDLKS